MAKRGLFVHYTSRSVAQELSIALDLCHAPAAGRRGCCTIAV